MLRIVRLAIVRLVTPPPAQMPNGTVLLAIPIPWPIRTTSLRLFVAPRIVTFAFEPFSHNVLVRLYVPGAMTMV